MSGTSPSNCEKIIRSVVTTATSAKIEPAKTDADKDVFRKKERKKKKRTRRRSPKTRPPKEEILEQIKVKDDELSDYSSGSLASTRSSSSTSSSTTSSRSSSKTPVREPNSDLTSDSSVHKHSSASPAKPTRKREVRSQVSERSVQPDSEIRSKRQSTPIRVHLIRPRYHTPLLQPASFPPSHPRGRGRGGRVIHYQTHKDEEEEEEGTAKKRERRGSREEEGAAASIKSVNKRSGWGEIFRVGPRCSLLRDYDVGDVVFVYNKRVQPAGTWVFEGMRLSYEAFADQKYIHKHRCEASWEAIWARTLHPAPKVQDMPRNSYD